MTWEHRETCTKFKGRHFTLKKHATLCGEVWKDPVSMQTKQGVEGEANNKYTKQRGVEPIADVKDELHKERMKKCAEHRWSYLPQWEVIQEVHGIHSKRKL